MENLKTESIYIDMEGRPEEYQLKERDYGDLVIYDIFRDDHYLLTLSIEGSILFMNFDADEDEKKVFNLSYLDQLVEQIIESQVHHSI